ncbi:MAG: hypothetical protein EI684_18200 [Candidatus Viridilinea halotolerans]|uniref:Uncharacterized protein n=1 Tax=Candidatus Viridilinea halotolerans TaxID=2491704 RepID=A0A426TTJ1_9CHLR|nr:MAG: hypothetical protein EI684_18200 [Candidatus Viridilinea halotolerans]
MLLIIMLSLVGCMGATTITSPTSTPAPTPTQTRAPAHAPTVTPQADAGPWRVIEVGEEVQIAYRQGANYPQVAVLHTSSSYFRLIPGPSAGWGTSVVLLPSFWSQARCAPTGLCQGAPVRAAWELMDADLLLKVTGEIGGLVVTVDVRIMPPEFDQALSATVSGSVTGELSLDERPGEAFKVVFLSSMWIAPTMWDAQQAGAECRTLALPGEGWIVQPPITTTQLWLEGGSSTWKPNAPTIAITLDRPLAVTGWVTPSNDPNDDNVGFWAAADAVLPAWRYTITALLGTERIGCD